MLPNGELCRLKRSLRGRGGIWQRIRPLSDPPYKNISLDMQGCCQQASQKVEAIWRAESNSNCMYRTVFAAQVDVRPVVQQPGHHVVVLVIAGARKDTGSAEAQKQQQKYTSESVFGDMAHIVIRCKRCVTGMMVEGSSQRCGSLCVLLIDVLSCGLRCLGMIAIHRMSG